MSVTANPYRPRLLELQQTCPKSLGISEWTPVTEREADVFDRLVGNPIDFETHPPGPQRQTPIDPFHLVGLLSSFASELGIPVPTDEYVTMLNYGFDDVQWHGTVEPGERVRDHVVLTQVTERQPDQFLMAKRHELEVEGRPEPVLTAIALGLAILL
jgi:acyl dehydratase